MDVSVVLSSSGIRPPGRHHPAAVRGDPGLIQKLPVIPALWPDDGERQQAAEADGASARPVATAVARQILDFELNHRLVLGSYFCA